MAMVETGRKRQIPTRNPVYTSDEWVAGVKMLQMFSQFLFETWNWNWNERSLKLTASIKISHYRILSTAFLLPFCVCVFLKKVKYPLIIVG